MEATAKTALDSAEIIVNSIAGVNLCLPTAEEGTEPVSSHVHAEFRCEYERKSEIQLGANILPVRRIVVDSRLTNVDNKVLSSNFRKIVSQLSSDRHIILPL